MYEGRGKDWTETRRVMECEGLPAITRGWQRGMAWFLSQSFQKKPTLPMPTSERTKARYFKLPSLWYTLLWQLQETKISKYLLVKILLKCKGLGSSLLFPHLLKMQPHGKLLLPLRSQGNISILISITELKAWWLSFSRQKTNSFYLQYLVVPNIIDGQELLAGKKCIGFRKKHTPFNLHIFVLYSTPLLQCLSQFRIGNKRPLT